MAVTAIDLNLEGDELVFYSGQRVKGALVLQISVPVIIAGKVSVNANILALKICSCKDRITILPHIWKITNVKHVLPTIPAYPDLRLRFWLCIFYRIICKKDIEPTIYAG